MEEAEAERERISLEQERISLLNKVAVEAKEVVESNDDTVSNAELLEAATGLNDITTNEELLKATQAPRDQSIHIETVHVAGAVKSPVIRAINVESTNVAEADESSRRTVEQFLFWQRSRSQLRELPAISLEKTINLTLPVNPDLETVFGAGATRLAIEYLGPEPDQADNEKSSDIDSEGADNEKSSDTDSQGADSPRALVSSETGIMPRKRKNSRNGRTARGRKKRIIIGSEELLERDDKIEDVSSELVVGRVPCQDAVSVRSGASSGTSDDQGGGDVQGGQHGSVYEVIEAMEDGGDDLSGGGGVGLGEGGQGKKKLL